MRRAALRDDRGSASVELAILAPLVGILLLAVVVVGRVQVARADVEGAARSAARELAIARDPNAVIGAVESGLAATLDVGSPSCRTMTFTPNVTGEWVTVSVACVVDLDDAAVLPVPGSMTVTATATEVIDAYRERGDA
jgi:Flp pilus assembly protein TadG